MTVTTAPRVATDVIVSIDGVSVTFRSKRTSTNALGEVNLAVRQGEFVSIVGPSGCGKSTLLKVVAGLVRPTTGAVRLRGETVAGPRRDIGYVFQRAALLDWRTAEGNILLQGEMRGMDPGQARRRCAELIEMTGLSGFEGAMPHELSGGMQQRVSLCRALLHEPDVLLMDEPFGALDALTRERMNVELHRVCRETGVTVLLVTHSVAEAVYLGHRVLAMGPRPGTVIEELPVDLPAERDYAASLAAPAFQKTSQRVRELLGSPLGGD
ncbi:ABC transporter ATP-binding protein [Xylanimonas protaetiae]|uniref:ABC transporter ATP-binding protein n=1 Tax=Xylanimonas protaetiae TaxID=2509457 RepID=A0A4P6F3Q3_9MICO|nr:ABC transporter ATP-binding protein [Xylanimonas protaetiae]QAY70242.1 ABC transporter ATP-binding protein [Xylanimonas protaetiae]